MAPRRLGLIAVAIWLVWAPGAIAEPAADPRLERADALLAEPSGYAEVAELYREVLEEDPAAVEVRLTLARVLAWQRRYEPALAEFDQLIEQPDAPATTRVERAEVLSWAGRLDEAEQAFEALLAEDPADARAARGLARVMLWSGREIEADAAFARALALGHDDEAAEEHRLLRQRWRPWLRAGGSWQADNDDFEWWRADLESGFYRTPRTTWLARVEQHFVSRSQSGVPAASRADHSSDRATALVLGAEHALPVAGLRAPLRLSAEAGARFWHHAGVRATARARLALRPWHDGSLQLAGRTGDHLDESESFAALQRELRASAVEISHWQGLGSAWSVFGRGEMLFVEDGNRRHALGVAVGFRPLAGRETRIFVEGNWMGYSERSRFYYDPSSDLAGRIRVADEWTLLEGLSLRYSGAVGFGHAMDSGPSSGLVYSVDGELRYRRGRWLLVLAGGRSESRRSSAYIHHHARLGLTREFGS